MLRAMRENTKFVLWFVLVAFLGGFVVISLGTGVRGCGDLVRSFGIKVTNRAPNIVGVVNGVEITYEQFQREYSSIRDAERERQGGVFTEDERTMQQLRQRTWDTLLQRLLMMTEVHALGISVTPRELAEFIISNPPRWITEHSSMQTDGAFDMQKYLQILQAPEGPSRALEATYSEMLPLHKLERRVMMSARTTSLELEREIEDETERVEAIYLAVRDFAFRNATDEDKERTRHRAAELASTIRNPNDFAEVAKKYSVGSKAHLGGRHGRIPKGARGAIVDSLLFTLDIEKCSDPLELGSSWFLYMIHDRGKDENGEWADISQIVLNVTRPVEADEIQAYYEDHRSDYTNPERAKVKIARISKEASEHDEAEIREEIETMREELLQGRSFEEIAEFESEDSGTAEKGGDLGVFGKGQMVEKFDEVAFSLQVGEISEPVRTEFGWHLIRVEEKSEIQGEEKVRARHILLKIEPGRATLDSLQEVMEALSENAREIGLDQAAEKRGLTVTETALFPKGPYIPGLGPSGTAAAWVFNSSPGEVSGSFEVEKEFVVLQTVERVNERNADLAEVRGRVILALLKEKASQSAHDYMAVVAARIAAGGSFEQVAVDDSLVELVEQRRFGRKDYVSGVGRDVEAIGAPFSLDVGMVSGPFAGNQAAFITRCDSSWGEPLPDSTSIRERLTQESKQRIYSSWFEWLKSRATIEDYREKFFGIS